MAYPFDFDHIHSCVVNEEFVSVFTHNKMAQYNLENILQKNKINYENTELQTQLSRVCFMNSKTMYSITGHDGRARLVNKKPMTMNDNFTWVAHSDIKYGNKLNFAINDIVYSQYKQYNYLITASTEKQVKFWSMEQKNILYSIPVDGPATNLALNESTQVLVICTGYDWTQGIHGI